MKLVNVSELRTAKDGRKYFVGEFRTAFGQKLVKRTFWQQFARDPKTGELTNKTYWERGSYEEAKQLIASGAEIEGKKITRTVEAYFIGDNEVNTYSTIMFPDENEITLFAAQNHPIVDEETGEILVPKTRVSISAKPAPVEEGHNIPTVNENVSASESTITVTE